MIDLTHMPFSQACQRNQLPILKVLHDYIPPSSQKSLLEIGSGTGQHAYYFTEKFPQLSWWTSDMKQNHEGIKLWQNEAQRMNFKGPLEFEIGLNSFPTGSFDYIFTANTFHIMSFEKVSTLIETLGENLHSPNQVFIYGPFKYKGKYTSKSNQSFDEVLKSRDPESGIRDFYDIQTLMNKNKLNLLENRPMPANNQLLVFQKV